jgi:hypothetical protein
MPLIPRSFHFPRSGFWQTMPMCNRLGVIAFRSACFKTGNLLEIDTNGLPEKKDNEKRHGQPRNRDTRTNQGLPRRILAQVSAVRWII